MFKTRTLTNNILNFVFRFTHLS